MDYAPDRGGPWRDMMTEFLESLNVIVLDPREKPIDGEVSELPENIDLRRHLLETGRWDELAQLMKPIRGADLRCCDHADFVICYLNFEMKMCGTWEELFWINREKKPILIVCKQGKNEIPPWLYGVLPHQLMFSSFDEAKAYITHIDQDPILSIDKLGRWQFFNLEEKILKIVRKEYVTIHHAIVNVAIDNPKSVIHSLLPNTQYADNPPFPLSH
jgi:hypothetical protein